MNEDRMAMGLIMTILFGIGGVISYDFMNVFGLITSFIGFIVGMFLIVVDLFN